jgi:hypothetical protein
MGDRQENRQDYRTEAREDWQSHANKAREDRQDWAEDQHWDGHYHGHYDDEFAAGVVVGATAAAAVRPTYMVALPCAATTVIVNGTSYYRCGGTWYCRGYDAGTVVYIVTEAPPGF